MKVIDGVVSGQPVTSVVDLLSISGGFLASTVGVAATSSLFRDGFESGGFAGWSLVLGNQGKRM